MRSRTLNNVSKLIPCVWTPENCCRSHGSTLEHSTRTARLDLIRSPAPSPTGSPKVSFVFDHNTFLDFSPFHFHIFQISLFSCSHLQACPENRTNPFLPSTSTERPPSPTSARTPTSYPSRRRAAWLVTPSSGLPRDSRAPLEAWSPKESTALSDCRTSAADRSPKLAHVAPAHSTGDPSAAPEQTWG